MNLIRAIMFYTVTAFLNHSVSENVDKVGEFEASGSTIASTDSRYLRNP
jgi:hypothetical protein